MEKPQEIRQVQPESTIEASRIQTTIDQRVVPFNHHEPFALQAMHTGLASAAPPPAAASLGYPQTRESLDGFYRKVPRAVKRIVPAQRRRTMIKAKQPANRPPPRIVIAKLKYALPLPVG